MYGALLSFFSLFTGPTEDQSSLDIDLTPWDDCLVKKGVWQSTPIDERISDVLRVLIMGHTSDPALLKKFDTTRTRDYDAYYRTHFVDNKELLKDVLTRNVQKKIHSVHKELDTLCTTDRDKKIIKDYHISRNRYATHAVEGADTLAIHQPHEENVSVYTYNSIKAVAHKMGLKTSIQLEAYPAQIYDNELMAGVHAKIEHSIPSLFLVTNDRKSPSIHAIYAHECSHLLYGHVARDILQGLWKEPSNPESLIKKTIVLRYLCYFQEKQADMGATTHGLGFARQFERDFKDRLLNGLMVSGSHPTAHKKLRTINNIPHKSELNEHAVAEDLNLDPSPLSANIICSHPSDLVRYIYILKTRELMEAEARWFRTQEADDRYGTVGYERGFQNYWEKKRSGL